MSDKTPTIPSGWKETTLGEVVDVIGGGTPRTDIGEYWNGNIPWLSVVDFNNDDRWVSETEKHITELGLANSSTRLLETGDIIVSARGTVGAFAQLKKPMAFNQSCYGLRAKEGSTNDFVYYLLKHHIGSLKKNVHGAVFDTITRDTFDHVPVELPSLPEQKAIAAVLSSLDDKIELLREQNKTLEATAQTLFKEWFVNFNFPDSKGKPYKLSGGKMTNSELGQIPQEWIVGKYSNIIEVITGKGIKQEELTSAGLYNVIGANGKIGETNSYLFDENLILTGRVGTLGVVTFSKGKVWVSDNVLVSRALRGEVYFFAYFLLKLQSLENLNRGSTQPLITQTDLRNIPIVIPPAIMLEVWHAFASSLFGKYFENSEQIDHIVRLRDILLPRLVSGLIRAYNHAA